MKSFFIDWRRVFLIAGILFFTLVFVEFNARVEELERLERQANITRMEATQAALTQVALEARVAYAASDQIVEGQARSEGYMIQEGDHPVIILGEEGETPLENPEAPPVPVSKPNWQKWWHLYFGEE